MDCWIRISTGQRHVSLRSTLGIAPQFNTWTAAEIQQQSQEHFLTKCAQYGVPVECTNNKIQSTKGTEQLSFTSIEEVMRSVLFVCHSVSRITA